MQDTEMVPYVQNNFEHSPPSTRSNSPSETIEPTTTMTQSHQTHEDDEMSDDEISVGCPSPALHTNTSPKNYEASRIPTYDMESSQDDKDHQSYNNNDGSDDYFKPLKRLKMIHLRSEPKRISPTIDTEEQETERTRSEHGVKSFSIMDILNHRPAKPQHNTRIVRPWDLETESEAQHSLERFHRHLKAQQLALLRNDFGAFNASYTSETGSDRSSSVTSDCCSPDIVPTSSSSSSRSRQHHQAGQQQQKGPGSTPLDALFQMTSKTFDSNNGEGSTDGQNSHLNLFNNRQQPKKKRKSRTAFTNHQIFELEKRFLYQKYLSPADRDEIAASLGLSNAQVITWFQNRRAKLKRDMEELKKDVESAKMLSAHKSFLENVQDLGILKKKAMVNMQEECPKNLVIAHENMQKLTRF